MPDFPLSPASARGLAKPVVGRGGYQSLMRRLQKQTVDGVLTVDAKDMEMILRYILSYGGGGFQNRLAGATGRKNPARKKR